MRGKQKLLIIVGPTSSGKSALAVELARKFNGEVISADSRQVYRGLDIGTGKITKREMQGIPHHLLDVASPKNIFTAHDYVIHTTPTVVDVVWRGKLPIICGGTGFYIDALVGRIALPDVPANPKLRAQLEKKSEVQLFALLKKRDPRRAKTIDPHNKRRLIRALEITLALGRVPMIENVSQSFDTIWIGIALSQKQLQKKIAVRLSARLKQGMIAEAKRLHSGGLSYKRISELGLEYRSLSRFLQHKINRQELEEELNVEIRRYAKRQLTYWRRNKDIRWFKHTERPAMRKAIRVWLGK